MVLSSVKRAATRNFRIDRMKELSGEIPKSKFYERSSQITDHTAHMQYDVGMLALLIFSTLNLDEWHR